MIVGRVSHNLGALLHYEGHSDLGFVGLYQLWDPPFSDTVDGVTLLITSKSHIADEVNTILCMVIG